MNRNDISPLFREKEDMLDSDDQVNSDLTHFEKKTLDRI